MHLYKFSALKFKIRLQIYWNVIKEPVHERNALARFVP